MINLKEIIEKNPECEHNSDKLKRLLLNMYPTEKARICILVEILSCGIAQKIQEIQSIDEFQMDNFVSLLENDYGYSPKIAKECIEMWLDFYNQIKKENSPLLNGCSGILLKLRLRNEKA